MASSSRRFRLRTILLYVNLTVLVLPIVALWALRVYENELIRRTEAELFAQGALVRALWLDELAQRGALDGVTHAHAVDPAFRPHKGLELIPIEADLKRTRLLPPAPDARPTEEVPPQAMRDAGEVVSRVVQHAQRSTLAGTRVVDHRGVVVASSRGELGMSLAHRDEVIRALRGEQIRLFRQRVSDSPDPPLTSISRRTKIRLFVALPVIHNGRVLGAVVLSRTPMSLLKSLYTERFVLLTQVAVLVLAVFLMSLYTSHTIVMPVHQLIEQTRRLKAGDPSAYAPLPHPVTHEVELLSRAVVDMAQALDERAHYIKTFASSVSHEFKTPLTSIRGTVELLSDHLDSMDAEERARFLEIIDRDADRLQRLVNRLLELARADTLQPDAQLTEVVLALDVVVDRIMDLEHARDGAPLDVEVDIDASLQDLQSLQSLQRVRMAPETFDAVLTNLLENARQHGGAAIGLRAWREEGVCGDDAQVVIQVWDDGPGVSEANRARIFEPFFTTARDAGGTGLGLAVVRSLLNAHGGSIVIEDGALTTFTIRLPSVDLGAGA